MVHAREKTGSSNQSTQAQIHKPDPSPQYWWMSLFFKWKWNAYGILKRISCIKKLPNITEKPGLDYISFFSVSTFASHFILIQKIFMKRFLCALLSTWDTTVKKPCKCPCPGGGACILDEQEHLRGFYSLRCSWSFHNERCLGKCLLGWFADNFLF